MLRKFSFNSKSKAFSLIELLVVISIFGVIVLIGSSSLLSGFISGRTQSASTNNLNKNMNNIFSFVEGQMNSAVKSGSVYGFNFAPDVIAFGSSVTTCNYLAYDSSTNALYTLSSTSTCISTQTVATVKASGQRLSSTNIKIISFDNGVTATGVIDKTKTNVYSTGISPFLYLRITATDNKNSSITTTVENTYSLSYGTLKTF